MEVMEEFPFPLDAGMVRVVGGGGGGERDNEEICDVVRWWCWVGICGLGMMLLMKM